MSKIKHVIIAHGGGDGVCAASIAASKLEDPIDIYFTQSYTIEGLILKLLRTEQKENVRIYILDIHINDRVVELLKKFNRVIYIDHHSHSIKNQGIFPGNIGQYKSSSQLSSEYFSNLKSPLATLGTISDKMLSVAGSDPMLEESILLQKSMICKIDDDGFRTLLVERMSSGLMPSQIPEVLERNRCTDNTINRLMKQADQNIIETGKCGITTLNENVKGFGRQIANNLVAERDHPVFILYPDTKRDKIVIIARNNSSLKNNIDLSRFMSIYFSGGGHPNASGGAIEGINNDGIQMVKDCFHEFIRSK